MIDPTKRSLLSLAIFGGDRITCQELGRRGALKRRKRGGRKNNEKKETLSLNSQAQDYADYADFEAYQKALLLSGAKHKMKEANEGICPVD